MLICLPIRGSFIISTIETFKVYTIMFPKTIENIGIKISSNISNFMPNSSLLYLQYKNGNSDIIDMMKKYVVNIIVFEK